MICYNKECKYHEGCDNSCKRELCDAVELDESGECLTQYK